MSLFSSLGRLARPLSKIAGGPLGKIAGLVPGLGTVVNAVGLAGSAYGAYKAFGGGSSSAPSGALPPLPGTNSGPGILPRGPGGSLQMPWNDASPGADLKAYSIDDAYLKVHYRAPRGYIVAWDGGAPGVGKPFGILKSAAKHLHYHNGARMYRHHAKPPISVGEYHSLKRAHRTIKKVKKIHGLIHEVATQVTPHGKVIVHHKKKGHHK